VKEVQDGVWEGAQLILFQIELAKVVKRANVDGEDRDVALGEVESLDLAHVVEEAHEIEVDVLGEVNLLEVGEVLDGGRDRRQAVVGEAQLGERGELVNIWVELPKFQAGERELGDFRDVLKRGRLCLGKGDRDMEGILDVLNA